MKNIIFIVVFYMTGIVSFGQEDVYLTVQIGAFYNKTDVKSEVFFGLKPDKIDKTDWGLYRYCKGKYDNLDAAVSAKENAIAKGIHDAFVTGYKGNVRITVEEALNLINGDKSQQMASEEDVKKDMEIVYSVQIGPYMEGMPTEEANIVLRKAGEGYELQRIKDEEGRSIYSIGKLKSFEECMTLKESIVDEGVWNAVEIAFINGEMSDFYEAIELAAANE